MNLDLALSPHFTLRELVRSETAERVAALREQQRNPPEEVVAALSGLATRCLEPLRLDVGVPLHVNSGYRSKALNQRVGGAKTSQHRLGLAADLVPVLPTPAAEMSFRERVAAEMAAQTGLVLRASVSGPGLVFAWVVLHLEAFDIDQVIHEYGEGPGRPAWLHVSSRPNDGRRQILRYHLGQDGRVQVAKMGAKTALGLCS